MIETTEIIDFYNYRICQLGPKQPSPRKPIDKNTYIHGYNDGWNAAVTFYKELGKI